MSLHPDELPLLHALVDGELDAANIVRIEAHLRSCADCRAELDRIEAVRARLGSAALADRAPAGLRARIEAALDAEAGTIDARPAVAPPRSAGARLAAHMLSARWASGALVGGLAAALALMIAVPQLTREDLADQLVQSHVRSLMADHMVDIATSDRHVVKPWFNGRIDFAPPVPELARDGFPLVGGRLDYVEDRDVAAIVYRRRLHVINLFVRPARSLSLPVAIATRHDGYGLVRWTGGGLEYWAVSDIDMADLQLFHRIYAAHATP